jgi:hypothetical protein
MRAQKDELLKVWLEGLECVRVLVLKIVEISKVVAFELHELRIATGFEPLRSAQPDHLDQLSGPGGDLRHVTPHTKLVASPDWESKS